MTETPKIEAPEAPKIVKITAVKTEAEYRAIVARRVLVARVAAGYGQAEVAAKTGIPRGWVSSLERAQVGPDAWRLGLIADILEVPLIWLLSRSAESLRLAPPRNLH